MTWILSQSPVHGQRFLVALFSWDCSKNLTCVLNTYGKLSILWNILILIKKKFFFFFFVFSGLHLRHMEVLRLGVPSGLQLAAYTTATATPDLSRVHDLHHSSQQCWILNTLSKARDLMDRLRFVSWNIFILYLSTAYVSWAKATFSEWLCCFIRKILL